MGKTTSPHPGFTDLGKALIPKVFADLKTIYYYYYYYYYFIILLFYFYFFKVNFLSKEQDVAL